MFVNWFGRVSTARSHKRRTDLGNDEPEQGSIAEDQSKLALLQSDDLSAGATVPPSVTPIEWMAGQPRDTTFIVYVDQPTCQIMEMVAVSRKQTAEFLRLPLYTDHSTPWHILGHTRLRRADFAPALAFQQQEDALNELEALFGARLYVTTELAHLDQSILLAFGNMFSSSAELESEAIADMRHSNTIPGLKQLLTSRQVLSDELARIDETGISALQKVGMPLPLTPSAAG